MAAQLNSTVVGVFEDGEDARQAVRTLKDMGFTESDIGVAGRGTDADDRMEGDADSTGNTGEGALAGAAAGAGIGALWGLGILAGVLPAIGPAIAGGTLAVLLSSAAAGAAAAGLAGALIGMGIPEDEAEYYESEMHAGRTIVTVQAGARRQEAMSVIKQYGGYDMSSAGSATTGTRTLSGTQSQGAAGSTGNIAGSNSSANTNRMAGTSQSQSTSSSGTVQAKEERLNVQKTPVETGDVTLRKEVHTEHKTVEVPVTREEVVIERRAASGTPTSSDSLAPGQEVRIPVREEQVSVSKETVVAEEVSVGKRRVQDTQRVDETLKKEEIKVEKHGDVDVRDNRK